MNRLKIRGFNCWFSSISKQIKKCNWLDIILATLIILIPIYTALNRIFLSDYFPINGDFQNHNGFRRLLDGQIPFKDFYFYLGLGLLYTNLYSRSCLLNWSNAI